MLIYSHTVPCYSERERERQSEQDQRHMVLAFQRLLGNLCSFLTGTFALPLCLWDPVVATPGYPRLRCPSTYSIFPQSVQSNSSGVEEGSIQTTYWESSSWPILFCCVPASCGRPRTPVGQWTVSWPHLGMDVATRYNLCSRQLCLMSV